MEEMSGMEQPDAGKGTFEKSRNPAFKDLERIASRLMLFDATKQAVFNKKAVPETYTLQAMEVNGKIAGWLGLRHENRLSNPLDVRFLRQQEKAFYLMGTVILILAAGISHLLARHLLTPIRQLAKGTRALTSFRFDTKVNVRSRDELGQLATDFNRMSETLN